MVSVSNGFTQHTNTCSYSTGHSALLVPAAIHHTATISRLRRFSSLTTLKVTGTAILVVSMETNEPFQDLGKSDARMEI